MGWPRPLRVRVRVVYGVGVWGWVVSPALVPSPSLGGGSEPENPSRGVGGGAAGGGGAGGGGVVGYGWAVVLFPSGKGLVSQQVRQPVPKA